MNEPPRGVRPGEASHRPSSTASPTTASGAAARGAGSPVPWHLRRAVEALHALDVDPDSGLNSTEAQRRVARYGAKELLATRRQ